MNWPISWTDEDVNRAVSMRAEGATNSKIAKTLGKTRNAISGLFYRMGMPNKHFVPRSWTYQDYDQLLKLRASGMSMSDVAAAMGRSLDAVNRKAGALKGAGWDVPALPRGGNRKRKPKPLKLPTGPLWELPEEERRMALWHRAKEGAAKTRQAAQ